MRLSMSPFRWQSPAQIITCASDQPATDQGANDPSPWVPPRPQGNISLHLPDYERTQGVLGTQIFSKYNIC